MAFTPCPCMDLQRGVRILAIVDIVLSCIVLIFSAIAVAAIFGILSTVDDSTEEKKTAETIAAVFATILLLVVLLQLILAVTLYTGANNRLYRRCLVWLIITIILTVFNVISWIVGAATSFGGFGFASSFIRILYTVYEIVVVIYFLKELNNGNTTGATGGHPTEAVVVAYPAQPQPGSSEVSFYNPPDYPNQGAEQKGAPSQTVLYP